MRDDPPRTAKSHIPLLAVLGAPALLADSSQTVGLMLTLAVVALTAVISTITLGAAFATRPAIRRSCERTLHLIADLMTSRASATDTERDR